MSTPTKWGDEVIITKEIAQKVLQTVAAAARDKVLEKAADIGTKILIDMGCEGAQWLDLCGE